MNRPMDTPTPRAVVVHGLADVRAALAPGRPVLLLSARGAPSYAGCGWWRALAEAARALRPGTPDMLDCADAPGRALEALRLGQKALVLDADCPGFAEVVATAATCGARLLSARPPALDLAAPGAAQRLMTWLDGDPGAA